MPEIKQDVNGGDNSSSSNCSTSSSSSITSNGNKCNAVNGSTTATQTQITEKPSHYTYLKGFRVDQCALFLQHKCTQHRPYTCFYWHFKNQRRRRPIRKRDGTFNYNPDVYCEKYDEQTGVCPNADDCPYVHRNAGDTEKRYHLRYFKTVVCVHETDAKGACTKNGAHCAFAHGANDSRLAVFDVRDQQQQQPQQTPPTQQSPNNGELINEKALNLVDTLERERILNEDTKWNNTNYVLINYKTEQCKRPTRLCRQGFACPQYHNARDKRRNPSLYKYRSTPCPNVKQGDDWLDSSVCENGDLCKYCHSRTEQQFHPEIYKSSKCNDMITTGYCPRGPFCAFAHIEQELKTQRTHSTSDSLGSDYTLENFITGNIMSAARSTGLKDDHQRSESGGTSNGTGNEVSSSSSSAASTSSSNDNSINMQEVSNQLDFIESFIQTNIPDLLTNQLIDGNLDSEKITAVLAAVVAAQQHQQQLLMQQQQQQHQQSQSYNKAIGAERLKQPTQQQQQTVASSSPFDNMADITTSSNSSSSPSSNSPTIAASRVVTSPSSSSSTSKLDSVTSSAASSSSNKSTNSNTTPTGNILDRLDSSSSATSYISSDNLVNVNGFNDNYSLKSNSNDNNDYELSNNDNKFNKNNNNNNKNTNNALNQNGNSFKSNSTVAQLQPKLAISNNLNLNSGINNSSTNSNSINSNSNNNSSNNNNNNNNSNNSNNNVVNVNSLVQLSTLINTPNLVDIEKEKLKQDLIKQTEMSNNLETLCLQYRQWVDKLILDVNEWKNKYIQSELEKKQLKLNLDQHKSKF